jgi:hypothetical protein
VLRRIFGPKRDEVTGEWRRLNNKELYALYSSPAIIRVIKSRRQICQVTSLEVMSLNFATGLLTINVIPLPTDGMWL